ncbi:hypothetical protein A2U01_0026626, partial [Trifolium medium]|nr:hypothetical protein [Trifolium medium]
AVGRATSVGISIVGGGSLGRCWPYLLAADAYAKHSLDMVNETFH